MLWQGRFIWFHVSCGVSLFLVLPLTYPAWSIGSWVEPLSLRVPWSEEVQELLFMDFQRWGKGKGVFFVPDTVQLYRWWLDGSGIIQYGIVITRHGLRQGKWTSISFLFFFDIHILDISFILYIYIRSILLHKYNQSKKWTGFLEKAKPDSNWWTVQRKKKKNRMWALSSLESLLIVNVSQCEGSWTVILRSRGTKYLLAMSISLLFCSARSAREMRYRLVAVHGQRTPGST